VTELEAFYLHRYVRTGIGRLLSALVVASMDRVTLSILILMVIGLAAAAFALFSMI
jgi:hypothetical protein